jgi:chemotaxis-related protein WspD
MENNDVIKQENQCWKEIGVFGSGICEKLDIYSHCRLCPVYSEKGRSLFDRNTTEDLIEIWTKEISEPKQTERSDTISVVIFRVKNEWFALSTSYFKEAVHFRTIHTVPDRTNDIFLGIANINGELLLCINSYRIFGVDMSDKQNVTSEKHFRMIVLKENNDRFVLIVDEILGVIRLSMGETVKGPSTLVNAPESLSKSVFQYNGKKIGFIDPEKLFRSLNGSLNW